MNGRSLAPVVLDPRARVRDGVLPAVESVLTLDADFWRAFGDPGETQNLAAVPASAGLVETLSTQLEALIDAEIGPTHTPGCRSDRPARATALARRRRLSFPAWAPPPGALVRS